MNNSTTRASLRGIYTFLFATSLLLLVFSCQSTEQEKTVDKPTEVTSGFDQELATKLSADAYGMGRYVLAVLKAGPNRDQSEEEAARLQKAHMDNIQRLADLGKLVVAGPFIDGGDFRGIYVFDVSTIEEARQLTESDPSIQAGRLVMELHPWYSSAALRDVNRIHQLITKEEM